uniref:Uncharacterized protein n=1 Tax=Heterorhabditis bacteriophora TaxID=37862 RepID=A0A1I7WMD7_HETBA
MRSYSEKVILPTIKIFFTCLAIYR